MAKQKPTRARAHELEDESYTKFRAARPSAWPIHKIDGSEDYGRDLLVEIFDNNLPTGNEFSVQLKAREKLIGSPKVKLKVSTLNHWEDQPSPTLIVLWDAATDQLFYEWAHRLPWSDPKSSRKTRTVPVPHLWSDETPAILADEADAYRKVRDLAQYFPVDVQVTGSDFFGEDAGPVLASIIDAIGEFSEFLVTFGKPRIPYVRIDVLPTGVEVSLSGTPVKKMTYEPVSPPPAAAIAGDVLFALSFAVGAIGRSRDVGVALLRAAVGESFMAIVAGRLVDAIVILARADARDALMVLLERTLMVEDHPNWPDALMGLEATKRWMPHELRLSIAAALKNASSRWGRPAKPLRTAAWLVGPLDAEWAISLWGSAVEADPATMASARYWSELGGINFLWGRWEQSVTSYRHALRLGDASARPLLADALMWEGNYAEALHEFEVSDISDSDRDAEWRLKLKALPIIIEVTGIAHQKRDDFVAEMKWRENRPALPTDEFIGEILEIDALYGWAWWAACAGLRERGSEAVGALLVAAVCLPAVPAILQELTTAALRSGNWETARDALLLARRTCGAEFIRMVHTDAVIDRQLRSLLLALWGLLDDEDAFYATLYGLPERSETQSQRSADADGG